MYVLYVCTYKIYTYFTFAMLQISFNLRAVQVFPGETYNTIKRINFVKYIHSSSYVSLLKKLIFFCNARLIHSY